MDKTLSVLQPTGLFAKFPKDFKGNKHYKGLSSDAKIIYTLGFDTLQLSKQNNWYDKNRQQHYILYSVESVMEDVECGKNKAIGIRKELEKYCLWEIEKQGANRPDKIYINEIIPSQEVKTLRYNVGPKKVVTSHDYF